MVDSNPYSRLMALQRMGIVDNYERIREFSVAIVVCIELLSHSLSYSRLCLYSYIHIYDERVYIFFLSFT